MFRRDKKENRLFNSVFEKIPRNTKGKTRHIILHVGYKKLKKINLAYKTSVLADFNQDTHTKCRVTLFQIIFEVGDMIYEPCKTGTNEIFLI